MGPFLSIRMVVPVRKKVKAGRYNNAREVVRESLRRMEDEDERALRLAKYSAEDILTDLPEEQLDSTRRHVRASIEGIEAGKFVEYQERAGFKKLRDRVKARGRKLLAREASGN
jgi:putative addiction module CopG family antidote